MNILTFIANFFREGARESMARLVEWIGVLGVLLIWGTCCITRGYQEPGWSAVALLTVLVGGKCIQKNQELKGRAMDDGAPLSPQP